MNQEEEVMAPMSASKQLQNQNVTSGIQGKIKLGCDSGSEYYVM